MPRQLSALPALGSLALALFGLTVWCTFAFAPAGVVDGLGRLVVGASNHRGALVAHLPGAATILTLFVGAVHAMAGGGLRSLVPRLTRMWPLALAPLALLVDALDERAVAIALLVGATFVHATAPAAVDLPSPPPRWTTRAIPAALLPAMSAAGALLFFVLAWQRHRGHWSSLIDLGLFYELFDNARGQLLYSPTLCGSFLGEHISPILVLAWPLVAATKSPVALLALQSACHGIATVLLGRVALARGVPSPLAHALAFAFLVAPHNQQALLYDFHMDLFVPPLLLGAWLAMVTGRTPLLALAVAGLFATKEDAFIDVATLGLAGGLLLGRWRACAVLVASGVAYAGLAVGLLQPRWREGHAEGCFTTMPPTEGYAFLARYEHLGTNFPEVIATALAEPLLVVRHLLGDEVRPSVALLLVGFAGLAVLARRGLVWLAPTGKLLLADGGHMTTFNFYYGAVALPFAALAAVEGARDARVTPHATRIAAALLLGTLTLVATHPSSWFCPASAQPWWGRTAHHERIEAVMAQVPAGARVSATGYVAVQLQPRRDVRMLPWGIDEAEWIVFDRQRPAWPHSTARMMGRMDDVAASGWWDVDVDHAAGPIVLRRRAELSAPAAIPWWPFRYEAEQSEMTGYRNAGGRDARASDGAYRGITARDSRGPGHLLFGPYVPMPAGEWQATFALRARAVREAGPERRIATLDVWANGRSFAVHEVRADELSSEAFTQITLPFTLDAPTAAVETRVYWHGGGALDVDFVEIAPRTVLH